MADISEKVVNVDSLKKVYDSLFDIIKGKQSKIKDLANIRKGSSLGLTAIQTETDPTIPSWAKEEEKPSYSASEIVNGNSNVADDIDSIERKFGEDPETDEEWQKILSDLNDSNDILYEIMCKMEAVKLR